MVDMEMATVGLDLGDKAFFTPEQQAQARLRTLEAPRGRLLIAGCRAGSYLSEAVTRQYRQLLDKAGSRAEVFHLADIDDRFTDSEAIVRLDVTVRGCDVFLFQALFDSRSGRGVNEHYMSFLIAARAFVEHGANYVTAVLPYLAYARQDKPTRGQREPTTAKLTADLTAKAGVDRLVTWHPHSRQLRGFYAGMPAEMIDPLAFFAGVFRRFEGRDDVVVVAPDAGASKLVTCLARALGLRSAIASKHRPCPEEAVITEIIGDFRGRRVALVVDDMISSGGTVTRAIEYLTEERGIEEIYLAASHNLCLEEARQRLERLHAERGLMKVVVTDSIPQSESFLALPFFRVESLASILGRVINRIHHDHSVSELFSIWDGKPG